TRQREPRRRMNLGTPRKLSVERATRLNKILRIDQILLFHLEARPLLGVEAPTLGFTVDFEPIGWSALPDSVVAVFPLKVTIEDRAGPSPVNLAEVRVGTRIFYKHELPFDELNLEFVDDYLGIVGWMHAWPYARAEIQGVSARMGFPPLLLPVLLAGQTAEVAVRRVDIEPAKALRAARPSKPKGKKAKRG
ncbi:MAG TPA: hypothetical protein VF316_11340, partial [Polyangiaceae bacterium]